MDKNIKFYIKLIHCGNYNLANKQDREQKNIFLMPMGMFALGNVLKKNDMDVEIIHSDLEADQDITSILDFDKVDAIGLDCHWANQSLCVLETVQMIKKIKPEVFIFLGGFTASLFADEILTDFPEIDAIIKGDADIPILELGIALKSRKDEKCNNIEFSTVQNLLWRNGESIIKNPSTYVAGSEDMDNLDFDDLSLLRNWETYMQLSRYYSNFKPISSDPMFLLEVGRGCTYACVFCGGNSTAQNRINNRKKTVLRSHNSVIDSIKKAEAAGFKTFLTCLDFDESEQWYCDLFRKLKMENLKLNYSYGCWSLPSKQLIDTLSDTFVQAVIEISPDSGDVELRKKNKDTRLSYTNRQLEECLDYMQTKDNVKTQLYFGYYMAYDSKSSILFTIEYIIKLLIKYSSLLEIEYANFSTDPGSLLFFNPDKYDVDMKVRNFKDYMKYIKEHYVHNKGYPADMLLFKPRDISAEEAIEIKAIQRLFNYLFSSFRSSVSYIYKKGADPDFIINFLTENSLDLFSNNHISCDSVRDKLIEHCSSLNIIDEYLIKALYFEYNKIKSSKTISKPTVQLYFNDENKDIISNYTGCEDIIKMLNTGNKIIDKKDLKIELDF